MARIMSPPRVKKAMPGRKAFSGKYPSIAPRMAETFQNIATIARPAISTPAAIASDPEH